MFISTEEKANDESLPMLIGDRIRNRRKSKGLSLAQLSEMSGVSVSMISKIEKGQSLPPISTYANIGRGLGMSLSEIVAEEAALPNISLVRSDERKPLSNGVYDAYSLAEHFAGKKFTPFLMHFPGDKKKFHKPFRHTNIQEMMYVLEGSIEFSYGERLIRLDPGDCVCFNGHIPHTSRTLGDKAVKVLAIQVAE
ncbi:MAG: XRE family transcriptional regulator [Desulfobacterales bacterium]|nr:XRE family transcriptional regulator [Desulfobacterales bacterium]